MPLRTGKQLLHGAIAQVLGLSIPQVEKFWGDARLLLFLLNPSRGFEGELLAEHEMTADRMAVVVFKADRNAAIRVLAKFAAGDLNAPSHFTQDGQFQFPALTIAERVDALRQLDLP
jgi:hypothetical protein